MRGSAPSLVVLSLAAAPLVLGSVVLGSVYATRAMAQEESVPVESGFTPDPLRMSGEAGGARSLREMGAPCDGFVGRRPSRVLQLETDFAFLRVFAVSTRPAVLALRHEGGRWRCGGERIGAAVREEGAFPPGRLEVWVGSPESGAELTYDLSITEFRSVGPSVGGLGGELDIGLVLDMEEGRFRGRRLRRGFLPDPREDDGEATGVIDVRSLGPDCRGFVDGQPSHVLTLRNDFDYFRVQLGDVAGQATLLVRTPGGRYLCSSPDERNAFVDRDAWPEGDYMIWVGPRERTTTVPYHICYTEVRPAEGAVYCGADRTGRGRRTSGSEREEAADDD